MCPDVEVVFGRVWSDLCSWEAISTPAWGSWMNKGVICGECEVSLAMSPIFITSLIMYLPCQPSLSPPHDSIMTESIYCTSVSTLV